MPPPLRNDPQRTVTVPTVSATPSNKITLRKPGGFSARTATKVSLHLPPLNQFRQQDTYWASRWGVHARDLVAALDNRGTATLRRQLKALTSAVLGAPYGYSKGAAGRIRLEHKQLQQALRLHGARPKQLRRLDQDLIRYEHWWKTSGSKACALAAVRVLGLSGAKPTRLNNLTARTRRRQFSQTPLYAGYVACQQRRVAKLYKGRSVTYEVRYTKSTLLRAARRIISRLRGGHPVHARVLTGYLHRNTGRRPKASHSLVINGYTLTGGTAGAPLKVDFHFVDPDGGGKGLLRLDVASGRFEHVPKNLGWHDRGSHGWGYDSASPPHRYQVLSIR
jgi:hypothetical protein